MSTDNLLALESKKSFDWKIILIGFFALAIICATAFYFYTAGKPKEKTGEEILSGEIRNSVVLMMAQPTFSGDEFEAQILGKGELQRFDWRKKEAYFSFPQADEKEFNEFTDKFFADRAKVELGLNVGGKIKLGDYVLTVSKENGYFFKTALDNIKIETPQTLKFPFKNSTYDLTLAELNNFTNNSQVYGGRMIAENPQIKDAPKMVFANHAIMVAKPNEPSLKRLTDEILKDAGDNREQRIQKLADFVSNEIEYSYTEEVGAGETLKRADEVLMTRSGDCSNKTILLASLLEQIGEDYVLLYCPRHITVAVPQGNFENKNKMDFEWEGKPWLIAETTLPGFQIGDTRVANFDKLTPVNYVQVPKLPNVIFDASSYNLIKLW